MDEDLDIDLELELDGEIPMAAIRCSDCQTITKHPIESLSDGADIPCSCGSVLRIEGEAFAALIRDLDEFNRLFDDL